MATNRRRTARRQGSALPNEIRALFEVGCGWNAVGDEEAARLWNEHGATYLRTRRREGTCWAEDILGKPNEQEDSQ